MRPGKFAIRCRAVGKNNPAIVTPERTGRELTGCWQRILRNGSDLRREQRFLTLRENMILSVGCTLGYQIATPQAAFTFNVLANTDPHQRLLSETIACTPDVSREIVEHAKG